MTKSELEYRIRNLNPNYVMKPVLDHGPGVWPVNRNTGEVCDCKMEWNEDGTLLCCPVCGMDGT